MSKKIYGIPVSTPINPAKIDPVVPEDKLASAVASYMEENPITPSSIGARPDTWTPTAEEVGAAPESHVEDKNNPHGVTAEQVGARSNTWLPTVDEIGAQPAITGLTNGMVMICNSNGKITTSSLVSTGELMMLDGVSSNIQTQLDDKAPAGYGLGTGGVTPSSVGLTGSDVARSGFYRWDTSDGFPFSSGSMIVAGRNKDASSFQLAHCHSGNYAGTIAVRRYSSTEVREWDYLNPPMTAGTYYRTTERCNGKPVYMKYLNLGTLPSSGRKHVEIGSVLVAEGARPISFDVYFTNPNGFMFKAPTGDFAPAYAELYRNTLQWFIDVISNGYDLSSHTGHAFVKWIYE